MENSVAVVILAAGLGKRMKSDRAKVLHELKGSPMIHYVVETSRTIADDNIVVVVGHQAEAVKKVVSEKAGVRFAFQDRQLGTGHAVLCAMPSVPGGCGHVIILCGDVPLIRPETVRRIYSHHVDNGNDVTVLAVERDDPKGYGRIVTNESGEFLRIVEEKDASDAEKAIRIVNSGIYCVERSFLGEALGRLGCDNAQNEMYLTDIVEIGKGDGKQVGVVVSPDAEEVSGVNSREDLVAVEELLNARSG